MYINTDALGSSLCSMAAELPRRLDQLCESSGRSFFELQLQCAFCNHPLGLQELAAFHEKRLSLIYRDITPYGVCRGCTRLSARCEYEHFCRCSLKADILPDILQVPLTAICVRCLYCYRLLDCAEKFDLAAGSETVFLVRNIWRGPCRDCRKK